MRKTCGAENIYAEIESLMRELYENRRLAKGNTARLREALDQYWDTECEFDCCMPYCKFKRPSDWIEYMGYTSLYDLLDQFEYRPRISPIKQRHSVDPLNATWARRRGHYNP